MIFLGVQELQELQGVQTIVCTLHSLNHNFDCVELVHARHRLSELISALT